MLWTAQGTEQTFNIEEPKEPHNLLFDFPLWLILVFFKRGVFKKKFEASRLTFPPSLCHTLTTVLRRRSTIS